MTVEELLQAKEGEKFQFKEAKNRFDLSEALRCCCALSNCGGGCLVLGITDKRPRKVVGTHAFEQPERTRMYLIEKLKIHVDFQQYEYEGKRVLVFEVAKRPMGLPVQADGVAWWYEGDSLIPMPESIRRKIYEESGKDFSAEICQGATIEDLDTSSIEEFRKRWVEKSGNTRFQTLSKEQLLQDCEAITDDGITYAALILFGKRSALGKYLPQSEIVFEYRSSEASGPAAQREEFRAGFFSCYNRIWELINLRNDLQTYQEGFAVYDIPTFNERVVREAVLNAVSHRNYQLGGSVFLRQYPDRLVVESPGGFPTGITIENMLNRQNPRNRRIAELFALCGFVERSGQGLNLMYELSVKEAKELPDFSGTDEYFVCVTLNGLVIDKNMLSVINQIGNEQLEKLSTIDFLIVNALYHEKPLSASMTGAVNRLIAIGLVERIGRKKYVLARRLYHVVGKSGVHTRKVGLDRDTNMELLWKHIQKNANEGTPFKELRQVLPNLSDNEIKVLMRQLKDSGKIYVTGKGVGSKWYATE